MKSKSEEECSPEKASSPAKLLLSLPVAGAPSSATVSKEEPLEPSSESCNGSCEDDSDYDDYEDDDGPLELVES